MSSISCAVSSDSSSPTTARVNATGAMIANVSREKGTSGSDSPGRLAGRSPMSPTVGTTSPEYRGRPADHRDRNERGGHRGRQPAGTSR